MLSTMDSGLLRVIFSTSIQRVSIWSAITELAFRNSFSCLASIPFHHAASPVHCSLLEDTSHNRRMEHLQHLAADLEGLEPQCEKESSQSLCFVVKQ